MESDLDFAAFQEDVRVEVMEHLQVLNAQLLQLERDPTDPAPIRQMFLSAHTVKGCAAMVSLTVISAVAHAMEDVLAYLRDSRQPLERGTANLLFQGLDMLRVLVERSAHGDSGPDLSADELVQLLRGRTRGSTVGAGGSGAGPRAAAATAPRVLLVENSPTVRLLETMLLTEAGFVVQAVGDGQQALALALAQPYELLVTGVETRNLRGPDLAAAVRETRAGRDLPIIVMSTEDDAVARAGAAEAGVQAYIRKGSFGQKRLVETARELTVAGRAAPIVRFLSWRGPHMAALVSRDASAHAADWMDSVPR